MRHLVNVGKTNPNKPKVKIGKMNITSFITMNYEQITMNDEKNKPKQSQSAFIPKAAQLPPAEFPGIFKPGTKQTQSPHPRFYPKNQGCRPQKMPQFSRNFEYPFVFNR